MFPNNNRQALSAQADTPGAAPPSEFLSQATLADLRRRRAARRTAVDVSRSIVRKTIARKIAARRVARRLVAEAKAERRAA